MQSDRLLRPPTQSYCHRSSWGFQEESPLLGNWILFPGQSLGPLSPPLTMLVFSPKLETSPARAGQLRGMESESHRGWWQPPQWSFLTPSVPGSQGSSPHLLGQVVSRSSSQSQKFWRALKQSWQFRGWRALESWPGTVQLVPATGSTLPPANNQEPE